MEKLQLIILSILILSSCSVSHSSKEANIIREWQGREIYLPDIMTEALTGDTIITNDLDYLLLTYVDSAGCISVVEDPEVESFSRIIQVYLSNHKDPVQFEIKGKVVLRQPDKYTNY